MPSVKPLSSSRRVVATIAIVVVASCAAIGVFLWGASRTSSGIVIWTASSGQPVPPDFTYIMFPPQGGAPILDHAGGTSIGTLHRAMLNVQSELSLEHIPVKDGQVVGVVKMESLRHNVHSAELHDFVAALVSEKQRGGGDNKWFGCYVELPPSDNGLVQLHVTGDDNHTIYEYQMTKVTLTPVRIARDSPLASLDSLPRFLIGSCAAIAIAFAGLAAVIVTWIIRR